MYSIDDIEDLTIHTYNLLKRSGINTIEQVKSMSKIEIMKVKGMKRNSIEELEDKLKIEFK